MNILQIFGFVLWKCFIYYFVWFSDPLASYVPLALCDPPIIGNVWGAFVQNEILPLFFFWGEGITMYPKGFSFKFSYRDIVAVPSILGSNPCGECHGPVLNSKEKKRNAMYAWSNGSLGWMMLASTSFSKSTTPWRCRNGSFMSFMIIVWVSAIRYPLVIKPGKKYLQKYNFNPFFLNKIDMSQPAKAMIAGNWAPFLYFFIGSAVTRVLSWSFPMCCPTISQMGLSKNQVTAINALVHHHMRCIICIMKLAFLRYILSFISRYIPFDILITWKNDHSASWKPGILCFLLILNPLVHHSIQKATAIRMFPNHYWSYIGHLNIFRPTLRFSRQIRWIDFSSISNGYPPVTHPLHPDIIAVELSVSPEYCVIIVQLTFCIPI